MNPRLQTLLQEYIQDISRFHGEYHRGEMKECEMTGCRLAIDLMNGRVEPETYRSIIEGKDAVSRAESI